MFGDQSYMIGAVLATILFIIALVLIVFVRSRRQRRDTVLFVGLSDAGKTKMFCRLITGGDVKTYTSQCENVGKNVTLSGGGDDVSARTVTLVDVPGADRVRKPRMHHWLRTSAANSVMGIVVVVDSATFAKQARDVAELIYDTLSTATNTPVLIVANKHDLPMAKSVNLIRTMLANELTLLHKSRKAALAMTDASATGHAPLLHMRGETFDWSNGAVHCSFVECACAMSADDAAGENKHDHQLEAVRQWICAL